jgi:hypothetical protein
VQNPFQSADLQSLPWWQGVALHDEKNQAFEQMTRELEDAYAGAVADGELARFAREYDRVAVDMIERLPGEPVLSTILDHAFRRLVTIYCYLRQRKQSQQPLLAGNTSVVRWQLDPSILSRAIDHADRMEKSCKTHEDFNLRSTPLLRRWIMDNYWPLVRKFCGSVAVPITYAHVRCMSADKDGGGYRERFRNHRFGNHHFDEDVYSLPLIIYLSEVSPDSGPFEYLSACDQYSQSFVRRAFHQALNHDCLVSSLDAANFPVIARLPSVFRGGDVIGNLYSHAHFENSGPVAVSGGIGTVVLFDGFNVIHAGGLPLQGSRKSLFVNFRFPVAKIVPKIRLWLLPRARSSKATRVAQ